MDIWLLEDDFRIAAIHADYIKAIQPDAQVQQFLTGASLKEALLHNTPPAALLMDLYIPDVTGYELVAYVRSHFPEVRIIMVTAAAERAHVEALYAYGVFDYIVKPFDEARLQKSFQQFHHMQSALQKKTHLSQQDLDTLFYRKNHSTATEKALPKGIDTFTLEQVIHLFKEQKFTTLTATQLSEVIGTSRSTARRYLEYLVEMNILETKLLYGTVGRPERNYVLRETYEQN
ncbi:response regulator [Solibacillus isronensis]|uniref:response regulator n=1 Tax=Solibacillus isronensis TaxID=412383 RepID=UPI00203DBA36|nr:response regulator [Solibacillus isronensis]MCM3722883.1 response regulator [Solibacillus isronensis]